VKIPLALFIYNRPKVLARTMVKIRENRPKRLYVFADGPKSGDGADQRKCDEARGLLEHVDWPCEVFRVYNDENYGLRNQIEEKLSFLFAREVAAVILEDDCLPENDFFRFCEDGLHAYEKSPQLMAITGNQYLATQPNPFLSRFPHCWGWATWRRAWQDYDGNISGWPEFKRSSYWQSEYLPEEKRYWEPLLDRVHKGELNSWAYRWLATIWMHEGLVLTPPGNLVSNIGFGEDGTHCHAPTPLAEFPTRPLSGWSMPRHLQRDKRLDRKTFFKVFYNQKLSILKRWKYGI
jgi:hypothetical protein